MALTLWAYLPWELILIKTNINGHVTTNYVSNAGGWWYILLFQNPNKNCSEQQQSICQAKTSFFVRRRELREEKRSTFLDRKERQSLSLYFTLLYSGTALHQRTISRISGSLHVIFTAQYCEP